MVLKSFQYRRSLHGVVASVLDYDIIVSEFELQSRNFVLFRADAFGKGMNLLILPPGMG